MTISLTILSKMSYSTVKTGARLTACQCHCKWLTNMLMKNILLWNDPHPMCQ